MTSRVRGTKRSGDGPSGSTRAGSPDTISFGRPVEPPEVGAFHDGDTTSGNGLALGGAGSGR